MSIFSIGIFAIICIGVAVAVAIVVTSTKDGKDFIRMETEMH